ncbi:hypothetical protein D3C81_1788250 [compost metagenome]
MSDWPVINDIAGPVTRLRAAECQVLEFAGEAAKVLAKIHATQFDIQPAVKELLTIPELRKPPGLAAPVYLLNLTDASHPRIGEYIVGEIAPVTIRYRELKISAFPTEYFLKVKIAHQRKLVGIPRRGVRIIATGKIRRGVARVEHVKGITFFQQLCA